MDSCKKELIPSHTQKVQINRTIGCVRFVYNPFLALRKEIYVTEQKKLNYNGCSERDNYSGRATLTMVCSPGKLSIFN